MSKLFRETTLRGGAPRSDSPFPPLDRRLSLQSFSENRRTRYRRATRGMNVLFKSNIKGR